MEKFTARNFVDDTRLMGGRHTVKEYEGYTKHELAHKVADMLIDKVFPQALVSRSSRYDPYDLIPTPSMMYVHHQRPGTEYEVRLTLLTEAETNEYEMLKKTPRLKPDEVIITKYQYEEYKELKKFRDDLRRMAK